MKQIKMLLLAIMVMLFTACGGGGGGESIITTTPPVNTTPPAEDIEDKEYDIAIQKIMDYADDNNNPLPTVQDYKDANVIGVETANLGSLNIYIASQSSSDVDSTTKIQEIVSSVHVSFEPDRNETDWIKFTFKSELTDETITNLYLGSSSLKASFVISCDGISPSYYISTEFVTGSGYVAYRFGDEPIVYETWNEGSSFKTLFPPSVDLSFLEKFKYTPDVIFRLDKFAGGLPEGNLGNYGFSVIVDQTRQECGWSEMTYPPDNGWNKEYPTAPPEWAKESTYDANVVDQFRVIAWIDQNVEGQDQLLVRLGDQTGPCKGNAYIRGDRLAVIQDGRRIPVVATSKIAQICSRPSIYALNGDFDVNKPFLLNQYTSTIYLGDQEELVSSISFP